MKKILSMALLLSMLLTSVLYGCKQSNGGDANETTENKAPQAEFKCETWVVESFEKVVGEKDKPNGTTTDIELHMSKNEKEGFNVVVKSENAAEGLKLELIEGATDGISVEYLETYLIPCGSRYSYPDPIVPSDGTFSVEAGISKSILVRFETTADTEAGDYVFKFALNDPNGKRVQEYTVTLTVWNITLPENVTTESAIGISVDYMLHKEKVPGRLKEKYYVAYYEMLLDYGLTAYGLPYDILNEKADKYMSDPRVTSFKVPHNVSDEKLAQYYEKLSTNKEWMDKAYFYPFDEPTTTEHLNEIKSICSRLKTLCPEINIMIPFFVNTKYDANNDEVDVLSEYVGTWCPKSACWNESFMANPLGRPSFGDRMLEEKEDGDKLWWYVCWEPGPPYNNLYVNEPGLDHIKLFWQQYDAGVEGFLYWSSTYWCYVDDPWKDMATVQGWLSDSVFGDGSLFYPGRNVGIEGPVASLRLDCIRNGIEDIELLKLAEEKLGKAWVDEQLDNVTKSVTNHTKKNNVYNETRIAIGEALEAALNNN